MAINMLVEGEWRTDAFEITTEQGEYDRPETAFRQSIEADPQAEFPAEAGRYHLYVARSCPWAHGTALVRALLGLEDVISMDVVDFDRVDDGWEFSPEKTDCTADTANGCDYLREVYTKADPSFTGRVTVPVLWDTVTETIVNNESIEIMRMFDRGFSEYRPPGLTLYPEERGDEIDRVVNDLYGSINDGVYRAGFAESQTVYDRAVDALFEALDHWEAVLAEQRYLLGKELTLADVRLFQTLVRFEPVYHYHFKCNRQRLRDYPQLWNYTKELFQLPGVAPTVNLHHIKEHYYRSQEHVNPTRIVPVGPSIDYSEPHDRDRLPGGPPAHLG